MRSVGRLGRIGRGTPWAAKLTVAVAALLALDVWSTEPPASDVPLPTYVPGNSKPLAATGGVLTLRDGCVYLESPPIEPTLLIWPTGFRLRDGVLLDRSGRTFARLGETVGLGGGELPAEWVRDFVSPQAAPSCPATSYWLVTGERTDR